MSTSSISSIPKRVDESSEAVSTFLAPKRGNDKREIFQHIRSELENAIISPDTRPQGRPEARGRADSAAEDTGVVRIAQAERHERETAEQERPAAELPAAPPEKAPRVRKMVEKSLTLDQEQYKQIVRYSNLEGLRLERSVPASEIARHLIDFALAYALGRDEILPTDDGKGMHLPDAGARK